MNIDSATNATETPNIKWTHPSISYKTPRAEQRAENRRRRMQVWAWSEASKRSAQRFFLERIISGRPARKSSCTSDELAEAYVGFCRAEGLPAMHRTRLLRLAAATLPKTYAASPSRDITRKTAAGATRYRGFLGIQIRPLTSAPRNTVADLEAALDQCGYKAHTRIVEVIFQAAVLLGWVGDGTPAPVSGRTPPPPWTPAA